MTRLVPPRFLIFILVLIVAVPAGWLLWQPVEGVLVGFAIAASVFLASCLPLLNDRPEKMRDAARSNDANRFLLLGLTVACTIVVLVAVGAVINKTAGLKIADVVMIVVTLVLAWLFGNMVYALHYAHMFYQSDADTGGDAAGIAFPGTDEPDYWDFIYFGFTLGMTFQTSDCDITAPAIRRVVIGHCLAAFIFNLGVLAFTINSLGA